MNPQKTSPIHLTPNMLDSYLANGWFRMRQDIFITHFLYFNETFYDAIWFRITVDGFEPNAKQQKLIKRCQRFTKVIEPLVITDDLMQLYHTYQQHVQFDLAETLNDLLGESGENIFNSYVVKLFDDGQLIAAGFFDIGKNAVAGISSIYHPNYKQYSLGKYLVLCKMEYCLAHNFQYFYPGYIVPNHARFTYKLDICPQQSFFYNISTASWQPYNQLQSYTTPLQAIHLQLSSLFKYLLANGLNVRLMPYRFFDAKLWYPYDLFLLSYPLYIYCHQPYIKEPELAILYNFKLMQFELVDLVLAYGLHQFTYNTIDPSLYKLFEIERVIGVATSYNEVLLLLKSHYTLA